MVIRIALAAFCALVTGCGAEDGHLLRFTVVDGDGSPLGYEIRFLRASSDRSNKIRRIPGLEVRLRDGLYEFALNTPSDSGEPAAGSVLISRHDLTVPVRIWKKGDFARTDCTISFRDRVRSGPLYTVRVRSLVNRGIDYSSKFNDQLQIPCGKYSYHVELAEFPDHRHQGEIWVDEGEHKIVELGEMFNPGQIADEFPRYLPCRVLATAGLKHPYVSLKSAFVADLQYAAEVDEHGHCSMYGVPRGSYIVSLIDDTGLKRVQAFEYKVTETWLTVRQ